MVGAVLETVMLLGLVLAVGVIYGTVGTAHTIVDCFLQLLLCCWAS